MHSTFRSLLPIVASMLIGWFLGGAAQATEPVACPADFQTRWNAQQLFKATADWPSASSPSPAPREFPMTPRTSGVAAGEALTVELTGVPPGATFLAATQRSLRGRPLTEDDYRGSRATIVSGKDGNVVLRLEAPPNRTGMFDERWLFAVAICSADGKLAGYGLTEVAVNPRNFARFIAMGLVAALYCVVIVAAWQCNAAKLQDSWRERASLLHIDPSASRLRPSAEPADVKKRALNARRRRIAWKLRRVVDPVFISQDVAGYGSLGRLQLLLFTFAVGFVLLNIYCATGAIAQLPKDVLILLGISIVANGASRLVPTISGLSLGNRQWLAQRRILIPTISRLPSWREIIEADGEIDITRVQALVFSMLVLLALVVKGLGDLSTFAISDEVLYLMGLSQFTYVAGKSIPTDAMKRLDVALDALRAASTPDARIDDAAKARFVQTRIAASAVLLEVYGARFRAEEFSRLEPLEPLPPMTGQEYL